MGNGEENDKAWTKFLVAKGCGGYSDPSAQEISVLNEFLLMVMEHNRQQAPAVEESAPPEEEEDDAALDWTCAKCGANNSAWRGDAPCENCGAPKVESVKLQCAQTKAAPKRPPPQLSRGGPPQFNMGNGGPPQFNMGNGGPPQFNM